MEVLGIESVGFFRERTIGNHALFFFPMHLQHILNVLWKSWGFSSTFQMTMHKETLHCDSPTFVFYDIIMQNFHLLFIPMDIGHIIFNIFNNYVKKTNAILPNWRKTITGASFNGKKRKGLNTRTWWSESSKELSMGTCPSDLASTGYTFVCKPSTLPFLKRSIRSIRISRVSASSMILQFISRAIVFPIAAWARPTRWGKILYWTLIIQLLSSTWR